MRAVARLLLVAAVVVAVVCPVAAEDADELVERARRHVESGRYDAAAALFERALETARGETLVEAKFRLAGLERDAGRAARLYREVTAGDAGGDWAALASLELAKMQFALGNYHEAYDLLDDNEACDVSQEACLFEGLSAIMMQRFEDARRPLQRVREGQLRTWAYLSLAEVDMGMNHVGEACERYASLSSALISPTALYRYGECLEDRGDSDGAKREYREIIRSFRDTPEAVLAAEKLQLMDEKNERVDEAARDIRDTPAPHEGGTSELDEGFTLQFGSFRDRGNAIKLAAKIKRVYPGVRIDSELVRYREYYRVRYGYFATREEARTRGEEISRQLNQDYAIMTLP
jgi:tetratricopeptide (TPR) repeat protein